MLLVKSNLRCSLGILRILVKGSIRPVFLLLDRRAKLHQLFRHGLVRCLEHIDQSARNSLAYASHIADTLYKKGVEG